MSYIGNAKSVLVIGTNVKDDLIPQFDGQDTFELSQKVPGNYEGNITVVKQKFTTKQLLDNSTQISIADTDRTFLDEYGNLVPRLEKKIFCNNVTIVARLAPIAAGDFLTINLSDSTSLLNDSFIVNDVVYTGSTITIYIATTIQQNINDGNTNTQVSLTNGHYENWSVLDPDQDYTVSYDTTLKLSQGLNKNDKAYVLHKGEATYNLSPSPKSVGPEQLQDNLRNFRCDRYQGNGTQTTFVLSGTNEPEYTVADSKTLLVSVDGEIVDSDGKDTLGNDIEGIWYLDGARNANNYQTITFRTAPTGAIRILHLGFSTISRRAAFAPGQQYNQSAPNSIGPDEIKNDSISENKLANNCISTSKLRDNSVTSPKILLGNNAAIRATSTNGTTQDLLKLSNTNTTQIVCNTATDIVVSGSKTISVTSTAITPGVTDAISLGTSTGNKFKDAAFSGSVFSGSLTTTDITATKLNNTNIQDLFNSINSLKTLITSGTVQPIGSIMIWTSDVLPDDTWLRCDGQQHNVSDYPLLATHLGNKFGIGITNKFVVPDLVTRFPVGANASANNIGTNDGVATQSSRTIGHTHTGASHTHVFKHTHTVPGHYHSHNTAVGSSINIVTSGTHTTAIDHTHSTPFTSSGTINTSGNVALTATTASGYTGRDTSGNALAHRNTHTDPTIFSSSLLNITYQTPWKDGEHFHKGKSDTSGSLDHVHRSWRTTDANLVTSGENSSLSHSHPIPVYGTSNGSHTHAFGAADTDRGYAATAPSGSRAPGFSVSTNSTGPSAHSHTCGSFYTSQAYSVPANDGNYHLDIGKTDTTLSHRHLLNVTRKWYWPTSEGTIDDFGHAINTEDHFYITGAHSHYVTIPAFSGNSSSTGVHSHTTGTFSGSIGNVIGSGNTKLDASGAIIKNADGTTRLYPYDGNLNITTNDMSTSDAIIPAPSATELGNTGSNASPHLVVNFIIKAKHTQVV